MLGKLFGSNKAQKQHHSAGGQRSSAQTEFAAPTRVPYVILEEPKRKPKPDPRKFARHTAPSPVIEMLQPAARKSIDVAVNAQLKELIIRQELHALESSDEEQFQMAKMRRNVVNELLNTEESYVHFLLFIRDFFVAACKNGPKPILSEADNKLIFAGFEPLVPAHEQFFLPELRKVLQTPLTVQQQQQEQNRSEIGAGVGQFFVKHSHLIKYYVAFINGLPAAQARIDELTQNNPQFAQLVERGKLDPRSQNLGLESIFVKPFQRILKYPLLISTLLSHTPPGAERNELELALSMIRKVVDEVNERKRDSERRQRVFALQKTLHNAIPNLVQPNRFVVAEGHFLEVREGKVGNPLGLMVYLLNDLVIIRKERKMSISGGWIKSFPSVDVIVRTHDDVDGVKNLFSISSEDGASQIMLSAQSQAEVDLWMAYFRSVNAEVIVGSGHQTVALHWKNDSSFSLMLTSGLIRPHVLWKLGLFCCVYGSRVFLPLLIALIACVGLPLAIGEVGLGQLGQGGGFGSISFACGSRWKGLALITVVSAFQETALCAYWFCVCCKWFMVSFVEENLTSSQGHSVGVFLERNGGVTARWAVLGVVVWVVLLLLLFGRLRRAYYFSVMACLCAMTISLISLCFLTFSTYGVSGFSALMDKTQAANVSFDWSLGEIVADAVALVALVFNLGSGMLVSMGSHNSRYKPQTASRVFRSACFAFVFHFLFVVVVYSYIGDQLPANPTFANAAALQSTLFWRLGSSNERVFFCLFLAACSLCSAATVLFPLAQSVNELVPVLKKRILAILVCVFGLGLTVGFMETMTLDMLELMLLTPLIALAVMCIIFTFSSAAFPTIFSFLSNVQSTQAPQQSKWAWLRRAHATFCLLLVLGTIAVYMHKCIENLWGSGINHALFLCLWIIPTTVVAGGLAPCCFGTNKPAQLSAWNLARHVRTLPSRVILSDTFQQQDTSLLELRAENERLRAENMDLRGQLRQLQMSAARQVLPSTKTREIEMA